MIRADPRASILRISSELTVEKKGGAVRMVRMSVKPRTIDNLGTEASVRYAQDQKQLDLGLIRDSIAISQKTEVPVFKPFVPSEFDQLFAFGRTAIWAVFPPPPEYFKNIRPLFTYQLIPSLGGFDKQEATLDRLVDLEEGLNKEKKKKRQKNKEEEHQNFSDEEEKQRQTLIAFFQCLQKLERTLSLINSRRNQYQRG